ncbi:putative protein kinase [Trypanosoma grayi]|uniref:putative protein kinase n=1 Tax=Trypanosoma grayi TaxID=71804 RepID=UPI0004F4283D|nr:putative protein kinase [Trypanosoma grayi]KEG12690.1 putative protein kinase [Trypanosoma grayi]
MTTMLFPLTVAFSFVAILTEPLLCVSAAVGRQDIEAWVPLDTTLAVGRAHSAVLFVNASFLVVGGCTDPGCNLQVNAVDTIDPGLQTVTRHGELPIMLQMPVLSTHSQAMSVPLLVAGPTTLVRVDGTDDEDWALYVVGACSYYLPEHQGSPQSSLVRQKYSGIWRLSNDLTRVEDHYSIHPDPLVDRPVGEMEPPLYRANASCISNRHLLLIVGGVDIDTGRPLRSVDVYNTKTRHYTSDAFQLKVAVRNPLVAVDSELVYVAGGEMQVMVDATESRMESVCRRSARNVRHNLSGSGDYHTTFWCPSVAVQAITLNMRAEINNTETSENFTCLHSVGNLPANMELIGSTGKEGNFLLSSKRHLFAFNGKLCVVLNSSFVNCLDLEQQLKCPWSLDSTDDWQPLCGTASFPPVVASSPFAFPLSVGVLGAVLAFFEIGGFEKNMEASARVFYRISSLGVTSVPNVSPLVQSGKPLSLTLHPPKNGYVRLSGSPACSGNAAGTQDVRVFNRPDETTAAVFLPTAENEHVYVCFANSPVELSCKNDDCFAPNALSYLYSPITFTPFRIRHDLSPSHGGGKSERGMLGVSVVLSLVAGSIIVTISALMFVRFVCKNEDRSDFSACLLLPEDEDGYNNNNNDEGAQQLQKKPERDRKSPHLEERTATGINSIGNGPASISPPAVRLNPRAEKDSLVKNTTHGSRYEVVRRIGEGAFSSVHLVRRKTDGQRFALKFLVCADNKERLDAIRECETINSVQGHPNIIRLVDMFMNYEFGDSQTVTEPLPGALATSPSSVLAPQWGAAAAAAAGMVKHQVFAPYQKAVVPGKQQQQWQQQQTTQMTPVEVSLPLKLAQEELPPPLMAASLKNVKNVPASRNLARQGQGAQLMLSEADAQRLASEMASRQIPQRNAWVTEYGNYEVEAVKQVSDPKAHPPVIPAALEVQHQQQPPMRTSNSPSLQNLSSSAPQRSGLHSPNTANITTNVPVVAVPPLQMKNTVHYCNFAHPSSQHLLPSVLTTTAPQQQVGGGQQEGLLMREQRTSQERRRVIRYKDFDATSTATGGALFSLPFAQNTTQAPCVAPATYAPIRYVQPAVENMQYTNFAAAGSGTSNTCGVAVVRTKPKSVADAVRAARMPKPNNGETCVVASMATPGSTAATVVKNDPIYTTAAAAAAANSPQPSTLQQPQHEAEGARKVNPSPNVACLKDKTQIAQPQDCKKDADKSLLKVAPGAKSSVLEPVIRRPLAAAHGAINPVTTGTSESGPVHTRFLGLVMEYHPMGDLCGYVLRHSAKHNAELRRQLDDERARMARAREEMGRRMEDEAGSWVHFVPDDDSSFSIFRPGKSVKCFSQDTHCQSSLDRLNGASINTTAGSCSCSNDDIRGSNCGSLSKEEEDSFIMRSNAFTEPQLQSVAYQLSMVLQHLHSQKPPIVHRDLKPENILIRGEPTDDDSERHRHGSSDEGVQAEHHNDHHHRHSKNHEGNEDGSGAPWHRKLHSSSRQHGCTVKLTQDVIPIVVTDFGLAFVQEDRRRTGRGGGTRPYIAPECWSGQTTTASDVWSLGCVLYALATARVTAQTVRIMYEEAKREGFAAMVLNDILGANYSLAFASFVVSLLVVNASKRPTAAMAMQCFMVEDGVVRFNPNCPFFSNVLDL